MIKQTQKRYPLTPYKSLYTLKIEDEENENCTFEAYLGIVDEFNPELYYEYDKYYEEFDHIITPKEEYEKIYEYIKPYDISGWYEIRKEMTPYMLSYENLLRNFNKKDLEKVKNSANFALSKGNNNKLKK